jgi:hypothetical protein
MKNLILFSALVMFAFFAQAQEISKKFLVGTWTSENVMIDISIINKNELNVASLSYLSGNYFKILGYQFDGGNFYLNTLHEQNNWEAVAKFIYVDENTMVADYVSNAPGQVIYKRTKNK